MTQINVSVRIAAPVARVWNEAADLGSHAEWMAEAESIVFLTEQRSGTGTRMSVSTRVGPLRTKDVMEVTGWNEGHSIAVRHEGLVTGEGTFTLSAHEDETVFTWTERLTFPWYLGGPLTARAAAPLLRRIWRNNLERFRRRVESS
jgi:uncharacterized protein YndB with AHSA1/START domain